MSATLFLDTIEVEVDALEPISFQTGSSELKTSAFPYPLLRKTGKTSQISLRVAILQNDEIEAMIAIDLGGRLVRLKDRRTGNAVFEMPNTIRLKEGGPRGVYWDHGIEWACGPDSMRLNGLGPVEFHVIEQQFEGDPAEIILHELMSGSGISWHARISLAEVSCQLQVDFRSINRSCEIEQDSFLGLRCMDSQFLVVDAEQKILAHENNGSAIFVDFPGCDWICPRESSAFLQKNTENLALGPRNTQSVSFSLTPILAAKNIELLAGGASVNLDSESVHFRALQPLQNQKIVLKLEDSSVVEANWEASEKPFVSFRLDSLSSKPVEVVLKSGEDTLNYSDLKKEPKFRAKGSQNISAILDSADKMIRSKSFRTAGFWQLACDAIREGRKSEAASILDDALTYGGDDHFVWWLKSALIRRGLDAGQEMPERPELLNAHYLAPLEPLLRVEAFLSIEGNLEREPSSVLKPIGQHVDAICDCISILIEAGLVNDAARIIDEGLRHIDHPNLHYWMAFLLISKQNMMSEAASHIQKCESRPIEAPLFWRSSERELVDQLAEKFPESNRINQLQQILEANI